MLIIPTEAGDLPLGTAHTPLEYMTARAASPHQPIAHPEHDLPCRAF